MQLYINGFDYMYFQQKLYEEKCRPIADKYYYGITFQERLRRTIKKLNISINNINRYLGKEADQICNVDVILDIKNLGKLYVQEKFDLSHPNSEYCFIPYLKEWEYVKERYFGKYISYFFIDLSSYKIIDNYFFLYDNDFYKYLMFCREKYGERKVSKHKANYSKEGKYIDTIGVRVPRKGIEKIFILHEKSIESEIKKSYPNSLDEWGI